MDSEIIKKAASYIDKERSRIDCICKSDIKVGLRIDVTAQKDEDALR